MIVQLPMAIAEKTADMAAEDEASEQQLDAQEEAEDDNEDEENEEPDADASQAEGDGNGRLAFRLLGDLEQTGQTTCSILESKLKQTMTRQSQPAI